MAKGKKQEVEMSEIELDGGAAKKATKKTTKATKAPAKKTIKKPTKKAGSKTVTKPTATKKKRYFKLLEKDGSVSSGRYTGETPKQAASKAYTKLSQKFKTKGKKTPSESIIYLRESTRGGNRKVYGYSASKQKLDTPQELKIKDKTTGQKKTIVYNYRNKIKKVAVPESMGGGAKKAKKVALKKGAKKAGSKAPAKKAGSKAPVKKAGSKAPAKKASAPATKGKKATSTKGKK